MRFPPAYPHDAPHPIADDVFIVRGSMKLNPLIRISRNMTVLRHQGELSLLNPIRLNDAGLRQLEALGSIRRIIRLGSLHGLDDAWYAANYDIEFWGCPGSQQYPFPDAETIDLGERPLPIPHAELFRFNSAQPEAAVLWKQGRGILFTCDALQHYGDYHHMSPLARLILPFIGFPKTTLIGPIWLTRATPEGGSLREDFERLLSLEFDSLFSAHGSYLASRAHAAVAAAVAKTFGSQ